ncbi:MAG: hypothetical protein AAF485_04870 [Chloroflexota bacterium]
MSIKYDIFARKEHAEPLIQIGSVDIEDPTEIETMSLTQFGESEWVEMVAVPHQAIQVVFSEQVRDEYANH